MPTKILSVLVILASLIGYLEWGQGNHSFLWEAEYDVLKKLGTQPKEVMHPFIIVPIIGQLLLISSLLLKNPIKPLLYIGMICIGLLVGFMLIVGILASNIEIIVSTFPFFIAASILTALLIKKPLQPSA